MLNKSIYKVKKSARKGWSRTLSQKTGPANSQYLGALSAGLI